MKHRVFLDPSEPLSELQQLYSTSYLSCFLPRFLTLGHHALLTRTELYPLD